MLNTFSDLELMVAEDMIILGLNPLNLEDINFFWEVYFNDN